MIMAKHNLKRSTLSAYRRNQSGVAAVEFALLAPVMVMLFFAIIEGSDALAASRRATLAANTLADLVAQETQIATNDLTGLFQGVELISNASDADLDLTIVSLVYDPDDDRIEVAWSRDDNMGVPYAPGSPYPDVGDPSIFDEASSLIVAELDYRYTSELSAFLIDNFTIRKTSARWPRRSGQVALCDPTC